MDSVQNPIGAVPALERQKTPQSVLGILSFALSLGVGGLILVTVIVAGVLHSHRVDHTGQYPGQMIVGFIIIGLLALDVLALGLGVAGLCEKAKIKVFAVLGVVLSSAALLGTIALIAVGLYLASRLQR